MSKLIVYIYNFSLFYFPHVFYIIFEKGVCATERAHDRGQLVGLGLSPCGFQESDLVLRLGASTFTCQAISLDRGLP